MIDFKFKKNLGQNFITDNNIIKKIIECSDIVEHSLIIEVGPGSGVLTKELVKSNCSVLCFEIDKTLEPFLSKINADNLTIVYEDFLKVDVKEYLKNYSYHKLYFISNLPYYITTPIITKACQELNADVLTIMVQKEVANRYKANINSRDYNSLSVFVQYYYEVTKLFDVSKNCFVPKPNVDSSVLLFKKRENLLKVKNEELFFKFVRDSFKQKRKNLRNNLKDYDLEKINKLLKDLKKDLTFRAEQISIEEFVYIVNNLI